MLESRARWGTRVGTQNAAWGTSDPAPPRLTQIGLGALKDSGLSWNEGSREVIMPERGQPPSSGTV